MRIKVLSLILSVVAFNIMMSRCSCSHLWGNDVETIIIDNDTIVVTKEMERKPSAPKDSVVLLDTLSKRDTIAIKQTKIVSPAAPFPKVDTSAIFIDSIGRKIINNRLCVIIMNQAAGGRILDKWEAQYKKAYPDSNYYVTYKDPFALIMQIAVPAEMRDSVRDELPDKISGIKFAVIDEELSENKDTGQYTPNDPVFNFEVFNTFGYDWYYSHIQAQEAWTITKGSPDVIVAIIDDYFDLDHPELNSTRIVQPYSVLTGTRDVTPPSEDYCHGTLVASLALGNMDNYAGACGIAPNCSFMPISIGGDGEGVATSCILVALLRAIHSGADVVNLSWGWTGNMSITGKPIKEQVKWSRKHLREIEGVWNYVYEVANSRNVTVVYSAGNERDYIAVDPHKRSDNIICVSSVDMEDHWSSHFSNVGNFKEYDAHASTISAPGEYMFGALPGGGYQIDLTPSCGTSFSAPLISGAVALLKTIDSSLSTKEIIEILQNTGKPVDGPGGQTIGNIVQIYDALKMARKAVTCFDDFISNPKGLWGCTKQTKLFYVNDGTYCGQGRSYYEISSTKDGKICGRQIMNQITEDKQIVNRVLQDKMYLDSDKRYIWKDSATVNKLSPSQLLHGLAFETSSYNPWGLLTDNNSSLGGYYGGKTLEFCRDKDGGLRVKITDRLGDVFWQELKRFKKIKKEYKPE